jgi:hypothetical protein
VRGFRQQLAAALRAGFVPKIVTAPRFTSSARQPLTEASSKSIFPSLSNHPSAIRFNGLHSGDACPRPQRDEKQGNYMVSSESSRILRVVASVPP